MSEIGEKLDTFVEDALRYQMQSLFSICGGWCAFWLMIIGAFPVSRGPHPAITGIAVSANGGKEVIRVDFAARHRK